MTLAPCVAAPVMNAADSGSLHYTATHGEKLDLLALSEPRRRLLMRTEWGFVQQNPRDGLRTAAGHFSLQGHDPTTDLSFRDLRVAELP